MDPSTNLKEQLELARAIQRAEDNGAGASENDAARLAELVLALHEWITRGGFLPDKWALASHDSRFRRAFPDDENGAG